MAKIVANELASIRRRRGFSQGDLARGAGISRQAVSAIEAGRVQPGVKVALGLARTLGVSVEDLFEAPKAVLEVELSGAGAGSRTAIARIGERIVTRHLDARETAVTEPASALVASSGGGRARLEQLASTQQMESTVFVAGCEPALGLLSAHVPARDARAVWFAATNRDALADLRARRVHAAALHGSNDELQRLLHRAGADKFDLLEIATIEEGWVVSRGNPKKLRGARDLARSGVRIANRAVGAAARTLMDSELRRAGVSGSGVSGYTRTVAGHADVARAVAFGFADIGVAVAGVADAFRLSFIPLRSERCVLAIRAADRRHPGVVALTNTLRSNAFRRDLAAFGPYDVTRLGEMI
jgi:putative molybdopterin biosynthesis protein